MKMISWNDPTLKSIAFDKELSRLFCANIEASDKIETERRKISTSLFFLPSFSVITSRYLPR